jgi:hypothetical protein
MKKRDIFLLLIIILLIAAFVLLVLSKSFFKPEEEALVSGENILVTESLEETELSEKETEIELKEAEPILALQRSLANKARFFIERYNTFSSDNKEENLYSIISQASSNFISQIEDLIEESSTRENESFYALQTKVLGIEKVEFIEGEKAIFRAQIQEIEEEQGDTQGFYKEAEIEFIYEDGDWKVNNLNIE